MYFITYLQWNNVQIRNSFLFVLQAHENYRPYFTGHWFNLDIVRYRHVCLFKNSDAIYIQTKCK